MENLTLFPLYQTTCFFIPLVAPCTPLLRYYEKEKRLPTNESRNPANKYRDYSDEDIERIWGIKLLIGIGFTAKEIYALMNDQDFDFDAAIAKKGSGFGTQA